MFAFHFAYSDGNTYDIEGVNKVLVQTSDGLKEVSGDSILTAQLPLKTMYLYSTNGCFTVSGTNLIVIDVLKWES